MSLIQEAAGVRRKAGGRVLVGLALLVLSAGLAAAEERPFHAFFGEGYSFLQKKGEVATVTAPDRSVASEGAAFQALFEESYAVVRREGQPMGKTELVEAPPISEKSLFQALFGEGYGPVVNHVADERAASRAMTFARRGLTQRE